MRYHDVILLPSHHTELHTVCTNALISRLQQPIAAFGSTIGSHDRYNRPALLQICLNIVESRLEGCHCFFRLLDAAAQPSLVGSSLSREAIKVLFRWAF